METQILGQGFALRWVQNLRVDAMKQEFIHHAARAFFASAWADMVEENGATLRGEIMDLIPDTIDPAAIHAANTLLMDLERVNGKTIEQIIGFIGLHGTGDRQNTVDNIGHYCAMQSMGHGVGLQDAFGSGVYSAIKVPYLEFGSYSLEKDYSYERAE